VKTLISLHFIERVQTLTSKISITITLIAMETQIKSRLELELSKLEDKSQKSDKQADFLEVLGLINQLINRTSPSLFSFACLVNIVLYVSLLVS
jgi:hypothetical protein